MTAGMRLFVIEVRRHPGLWLLPVLAGLAWYGGRERYPDGVTLWIDTSFNIGMGMVLAGFAASGLAAYIGGRDRRRGMSELLTTTPRPPVARVLALWSATTVWGVLAYLAVGAYFFAQGLQAATWGGPEPLPIVIGLLVMVTAPAIGYAAGALIPSRFVVPLVPLVLYLVQAVAIYQSGSATEFLSPWGFLQRGHTVFWAINTTWGLWLCVWLIALAVVALAATLTLQHRGRAASVVLVAAIRSAGLAGGVLLVIEDTEAQNLVAYEPRCTGTAIPVCVHPAYAAMLDETAEVVGPVLAPLAGVRGAPLRAGQFPFDHESSDEILPVGVWSPSYDSEAVFAYGVAADVVAPDRYSDPNFTDKGPGLSEVQGALIIWLMRQADPDWAARAIETRLPLLPDDVPWEEQEEHLTRLAAAAERFEALAPAARRSWLERHFVEVRASELSIEDLP